jgi:hypothetical protein
MFWMAAETVRDLGDGYRNVVVSGVVIIAAVIATLWWFWQRS